MKGKTKGYYEFDPVLLPRKLWVWIGDDHEALSEAFEGIEKPSKDYNGVTFGEISRKSDDMMGELVVFHKTKDMTMGVVSHEASHVVDFIEDAIGADHGGEYSAYLLGWVASCINKARLGVGDFVEVKEEKEEDE